MPTADSGASARTSSAAWLSWPLPACSSDLVTWLHIHMHTYTHTHIHTHTHLHTYTHTHIHIPAHTHTCTRHGRICMHKCGQHGRYSTLQSPHAHTGAALRPALRLAHNSLTSMCHYTHMLPRRASTIEGIREAARVQARAHTDTWSKAHTHTDTDTDRQKTHTHSNTHTHTYTHTHNLHTHKKPISPNAYNANP